MIGNFVFFNYKNTLNLYIVHLRNLSGGLKCMITIDFQEFEDNKFFTHKIFGLIEACSRYTIHDQKKRYM